MSMTTFLESNEFYFWHAISLRCSITGAHDRTPLDSKKPMEGKEKGD